MKERPILFKGELVRAILEGRKTQTRRLVKPSTVAWLGSNAGGMDSAIDHCPYGSPGDRLWVRESWGDADHYYQGHVNDCPSVVAYSTRDAIQFDADEPTPIAATDMASWNWDKMKWRPSIHMPRWASRIDLEVVEVRVQRLQDITEEDAREEGLDEWIPCNVITGLKGVRLGGAFRQATCREHFAWLWDIINGKRATWASNPWVWAITFRRVGMLGGREP